MKAKSISLSLPRFAYPLIAILCSLLIPRSAR